MPHDNTRVVHIGLPARLHRQLAHMGGPLSEHIMKAIDRFRPWKPGQLAEVSSIYGGAVRSFAVCLPEKYADTIEQPGGGEYVIDAVEQYVLNRRKNDDIPDTYYNLYGTW